jgi:hypothetical protein
MKSKPCPLFEIKVWIAIGGMWAILKFDDVREIILYYIRIKKAFSNQLVFDYMSSSTSFDYTIIFI